MKYLIILVFCLGVQGGEIRPELDASLQYVEEDVRNEDNFYRPCRRFKDWDCVRNFLAENSDCEPTFGKPTDPLYLKQNTVNFPFVNMTNILAENTIKAESVKIIEFYYNKKTRNLVLAVEVRNLNETIQKSIYRYRRTARETIILTDFATVNFKKLIFTAIIPKIDHKLRIDLGEYHTDIREDYPEYYIGPKAHASTDPDVKVAFKEFVKFWPLLLREAIFTQAPLLTPVFIQYCLCDFGIKYKSV